MVRGLLLTLALAGNACARCSASKTLVSSTEAQACNPRLSLPQRLVIADAVFTAAKKHEVPVSQILGIIRIESTFNTKAVSSYGAVGLMQVVPRIHKERIGAASMFDPKPNVDVGTSILKEYVTKHGVNAGLVRYSGNATDYGAKFRQAVAAGKLSCKN